MENILVSACLMGAPVRYNGKSLGLTPEDAAWLTQHFNVMTFCPEVSAGLPTPRVPAEIMAGEGSEVLFGTARVAAKDGVDQTAAFIHGAHLALAFCRLNNIRYAILTESSPSCGSSTIHDGTFSGVKKAGIGVTAALLERHGICVINQHSISELKATLNN